MVHEVAPETYARGRSSPEPMLPDALHDVMHHLPAEGILVGDLALLVFDHDDEATRNRLSVRLHRLLAMGLVERVGRGSYRPALRAEPVSTVSVETTPEEDAILAQIVGDGVPLVDLVKRLDGAFTPRRRREVLDMLQMLKARGVVEETAAGWRRLGSADARATPTSGALLREVSMEPSVVGAALSRETAAGPVGVGPEAAVADAGETFTCESKVEGRVDLARVLWALEWAKKAGKGSVTAAEIARICTEEGGVKVQGTNIGRFLKECREKGKYAGMWLEERGRYRAS